MNAERFKFERLVQRARSERSPTADVAARVQASLETRVRPASIDWPLVVAAALSVSLALLVMVAVGYQHTIVSDPIAELFLPLANNIQ